MELSHRALERRKASTTQQSSQSEAWSWERRGRQSRPQIDRLKKRCLRLKRIFVSKECKLVVPHQGEGYGKVEVNRQVDPARQGCSPQDDRMNDSTTTSEGASTYFFRHSSLPIQTAHTHSWHFSLILNRTHEVSHYLPNRNRHRNPYGWTTKWTSVNQDDTKVRRPPGLPKLDKS